VSREALERAVREHIDRNFFGVRLGAIRHALEQLPWMRSVDVRRVWPDRLEVALEEHVALARWGSDGLIDTYGELFSGRGGADLPLFVGPDGSEGEITERYRNFSAILRPLGAPIERVVLTPRYAWQLRLANGLHLMLGRDGDLAERRLQRFVDVYGDTVGRVPGPHDYVDLRYADGFALRVKG
jgi:cell division protein FtsQ